MAAHRLARALVVVAVLCCLGLDGGHLLHAQQSADALLSARRYRDAIPVIARNLQEARDAGREADVAEALGRMASALYNTDDHAGARAHALEGLARADALGAHGLLGQLQLLLSILDELAGARAEALRWARSAEASYRTAGDERAGLNARLQGIRLSTAPVDELAPLLQATADEARALGDTRLEGRALHNLADEWFTAGRLDAAYDTLMLARPVVEATGHPVALGTLYNSIGRVYRAHGRLDDALVMQLEALRLHEQAGDTITHMQSLNAVAVVYQLLGDLPRARQYTERALARAVASGSTRAHDFLQGNLAGLLLDEGDAPAAARVLEAVIAAGRDVHISVRYAQLSEAYARMGRPDAARRAAQDALDSCGTAEETCLRARASLARALAASGDAPAALRELDASHAMVERLRAGLVPSDFFRRDFPLVHERLFGRTIALQMQEGRHTEALETAERSRARAFLDLLASRGVGASELSPAAPSARPASARQLAATAARLTSTMVAYWVADQELFIWVVSPTGEVQARRVPVLRSTLARLVRETSPLQTQSEGAAADGPLTRGRGRPSSARSRAAVWRELHALLIEPVRTALPTSPGALLTVVPHGPLMNLSFAALRSAGGRYLLEDYTLHYVPAGALLDFTTPRRRPDGRTGPLLLVADPDPPSRPALDGPLARLPGARREVRAVAGLEARADTTMLVGAEATEGAVRARVGGPAVLHFATHAIVRDADPFTSFLALSAGSDAGDDDGVLSAQDVYGLPLQADLVVLSACQSAGGTVRGDGVATFARAFLYAGAAALVASVWDVADEPTPRLLPAFYRAWQGGATKAQALRQAQLELLRELRAGRVHLTTPIGPVPVAEHPVFWAGFVLFGEPD